MLTKLVNRSILLILILSFSFVAISDGAYADSFEDSWTWLSGSEFDSQAPLYGLIGVEDSNAYPGAREGSATILDASRNCLWIFGGYGYDNDSYTGYMNDLWRFNITSQKWAWLSGSAYRNNPYYFDTWKEFNASNVPSARYECASWMDQEGNLWIFGGQDHTNYFKADMWCYNITSNSWAIMSGSIIADDSGYFSPQGVYHVLNFPPARATCASWTAEDGGFYLFGGQLPSSNLASDVWKFDTTINQWAWIGGSSSPNTAGIYGVQFVESAVNIPGSRATVAAVSNGTYAYVFGGWGRSETGAVGYLNDFWRFSTINFQWAWLSGSKATNSAGSYGVKDVFNSSNSPPSRRHGVSCIDTNDDLWLFGGYHPLSGGGLLNDLWKYDFDLWQWAWISGNNTLNAGGNYGVEDEPSSSNFPGSRQRTNMHCDADDNIWIFGGNGLDSTADQGHLNDLWMFTEDGILVIHEYSYYQYTIVFVLGTLVAVFLSKKKKEAS